jgi:hypothetical protein
MMNRMSSAPPARPACKAVVLQQMLGFVFMSYLMKLLSAQKHFGNHA